MGLKWYLHNYKLWFVVGSISFERIEWWFGDYKMLYYLYMTGKWFWLIWKIRRNIELVNQITKTTFRIQWKFGCRIARLIIIIGGDKIQIEQKAKVCTCVIMRKIQGSLMPPPPFNSIWNGSVWLCSVT